MTKKTVCIDQKHITIIISHEAVIYDAQSAMDLIATSAYEDDSVAIILNKEALDESFFELRSGLAGEVLQKFINYHMQLAVVGDFSNYNSKALKDFIYESNKGKSAFFVESEQEALEKIAATNI